MSTEPNSEKTSNINTSNIDKDYPRPGEDNNTEGFRSNFSVIADQLDTAGSEIEDLLKNTARTDEDVSFNGNQVEDADLRSATFFALPRGKRSSDTDVDFYLGHYQQLTLESSLAVTLKGWPQANRLAKITLELVLAEGVANADVTFATESASAILKKHIDFPDPVTVSGESSELVEFWTIDGGETVFANYLGTYSV